MANVLVLCGGRSAEHEISLLSAEFICQLLESRHTCLRVYIDRQGTWHLMPASLRPSDFPAHLHAGRRVSLWRDEKGVRLWDLQRGQPMATVDIAFPALHGPYGEDGTVQGLFETVGLPYVGAGVLGSAIGMDKASTKRILRSLDLPVVRFQVVEIRDWRRHRSQAVTSVQASLSLPVFVKPSNLGSSIGVSRVETLEALERAIDLALEYDDTVLVEEALEPVREVECSVLDGDPPVSSVVGEVTYRRRFYDYEAKYHDPYTELIIPAPLPPKIAERTQRLAVQAFRALRCQGMARVDFLLHPERGLFINEVNTIPGFTPYSMYHRLWEASGLPPEELVERLLQLAWERYHRRRRLRLTPT